MCPPVRPTRSSMSGGPSTSEYSMQSAMSGAKRPMRSRNCLPMASRCSSHVVPAQLVRRVLPEHAHEVAALGRGGGVVAGLEVDLAVADVGDAGLAVLEGPLGGVEALRHRDHRAERPRLARGRRERGQAGERGVELHDRAADLPGLEPLPVRRRARRPSPRACRAHASGRRCRPPCGPEAARRRRGGRLRRGGSRPPRPRRRAPRPASTAASARAKLTMPMPPRT